MEAQPGKRLSSRGESLADALVLVQACNEVDAELVVGSGITLNVFPGGGDRSPKERIILLKLHVGVTSDEDNISALAQCCGESINPCGVELVKLTVIHRAATIVSPALSCILTFGQVVKSAENMDATEVLNCVKAELVDPSGRVPMRGIV